MEKRIARSQAGRSVLAAFLAGLLAICLTGALTLHGGQKAQAVDVSENAFSITAQVDEGNDANAPKNLEFSLYQVAAAEPLQGYDAFTLAATAPFESSLGAQIEGLSGAQSSSVSTDDLIAMANVAAGVVATASEDALQPQATAAVGSAASGLPAGMYLMVVTQEKADISASAQRGLEQGENGWVSHAYGSTMRYAFQPQLVTVPTKESADGVPIEGIPTTATPGVWQPDVTVTLKYTEEVRTGSLKIVKQLDVIQQIVDTSASATFVFQVEGQRAGETVLSDVVTIKFTGAGTEEAIIENIPIDVDITVTEVYSGASYKPVGDITQGPVRVVATDGPNANDEPTTVTFANTYDRTGNRGGSVINSFQNGGEGGWKLNQDTEVA